MTTLSNPPSQTRTFSVPNMLTYARIAAVPTVVACMYGSDILQGGLWLRWIALTIFIAAGVTDFLDGYFARAWGQHSSFGRMLDQCSIGQRDLEITGVVRTDPVCALVAPANAGWIFTWGDGVCAFEYGSANYAGPQQPDRPA